MSKTYILVIVSLLNQLLQWAGVTVVEGQIEIFLNIGVGIITAFGIAYERFQKGGINMFGVRK